jgi:hypothetical protein
MRARAHTTTAAALELGATGDELRAWCGDLEPPDRRYHPALVGYLGIDEVQLRGLILRSQMRRTQARIRG